MSFIETDTRVISELKNKINGIKERRIREEERVENLKREYTRLIEDIKAKYGIDKEEINKAIEESERAMEKYLEQARECLKKIAQYEQEINLPF